MAYADGKEILFSPIINIGEGDFSNSSSIIDVETLPTEDIQEGVFYRIPKFTEPTADIYIADGDNSGITCLTLQEYGQKIGVPINVHIYRVDAVPAQMTISTESASSITVHAYVLPSGIVWINTSEGTLQTAITLGQYLALPDGGAVTDISKVTTPAIYTVLIDAEVCGYNYYLYENGKWVEYSRGSSSGGIIEVDSLPIENIQEGVFYKVYKEPIAEIYIAGIDESERICFTLEDYAALLGVTFQVITHIVDELPEAMNASILGDSSILLHAYILKSTGFVYASIDGTRENAITAGEYLAIPNGGWSEDATEETEMALYTVLEEDSYFIYENGTWKHYTSVPSLQAKKITNNGFYMPDEGYDGFSFVNVDVPEPRLHSDYTFFKNGTYYPEAGYNGFASVSFANRTLSEVVNKNITELTPEDLGDITRIGSYAFYHCFNLTSVNLPDCVQVIDEAAFERCSKLGSVNLPDCVQVIGTSAFSQCYALANINIPNGVLGIGAKAFYACSSLISVDIPDSVDDIGDDAFYGCENVIVKENNIHYVDKWVVGCDASATSLNFKTNTVGIADYAFKNGKNLTSAVISDSIKYIGENAFHACSSLTSVTIGKSVKDLRQHAFSSCKKLTSIVIPDSVTYLGYCVIGNCDNLTDIYYNGTKSQWNAIKKSEFWNQGLSNYTIHCTDGDITA